MVRSFSPASSLHSLRKEARRWLKALRAGNTDAFSRLRQACPDAPAEPGLRDVQRALAREHGLPGWQALRTALEVMALERQSLPERAELVARAANWGADTTGACRILQRWPEVASFDLATALATGHRAEVRRRIGADLGAAARRTGPLDREPLLYLVYSRLPGFDAHAAELMTLLLDQGADPGAAFDDGWGNRFTVLTGLLGHGEGVQPVHPQARELAELLIARGADPFDSQALYNTSIVGDDITWLEYLWSRSVARGRDSAWLTVQPQAIGGNLNLPPMDYLLGNAVAFGHEARVRWLLEHGASANALHAYSKQPVRNLALLQGNAGIASLLEAHGAEASPPDAFLSFHLAALALDHDAAAAVARREPGVLARHETLHHAAAANHVAMIDLLLDLGVGVDVPDDGAKRPIHLAAEHGALEAVVRLVARGADIDGPTKYYGGAMGAAAFRGQRTIAEWLAPRSRDINPITYFGLYERLATLLAEEPALINQPHVRTGNTPLFTLPQEEEESLRMAEFLLARGADPAHVNVQGQTADVFLRARGLLEAADVIEAAR